MNLRQSINVSMLIILGILTIVIIALLILQRRMIYFPRPYDANVFSHHSNSYVELEYRTGEGSQVAFYVPPRKQPGKSPEQLWILFGGNASLALVWEEFIDHYPDPFAGFLLIDYPGYGKCEGSASPSTILQSTERALVRLATYMNIPEDRLSRNLNVLGHSLGAAAALQFVVNHRVDRAILVAPFTSLRDMARRVVGWPLCYLLLQDFDNRARLAELSSHEVLPKVTIIHGDCDEVIPVTMGRELSRTFPNMISYVEIKNGDHNSLVSEHEREIFESMGN
jgi:uncharacterized protein